MNYFGKTVKMEPVNNMLRIITDINGTIQYTDPAWF